MSAQNRSPGALAGAHGAVTKAQDKAQVTEHSRNPQASTPVLIAKNQREMLRLSIDEYKGRMLLSCRLWYFPREGGDLRPGRDGWAVSIEKLPEIITGLQRLDRQARESGVLK